MLSMMTLNICIESYGAAVHVMDAILASGLQVRPTSVAPIRVEVSVAEVSVAEVSVAEVSVAEVSVAEVSVRRDFDSRVRSAVAALDYECAQAVWLVDVCGCSYNEAAHEANIGEHILAERVANGRRAIRSQMTAV